MNPRPDSFPHPSRIMNPIPDRSSVRLLNVQMFIIKKTLNIEQGTIEHLNETMNPIPGGFPHPSRIMNTRPDRLATSRTNSQII